MEYSKSSYFHVGRATDLKDRKDRLLYRFFEMLPGILSWGTILGCFIFSFIIPRYVAYFIIVFDFYWLLKTAYLSIHLRHNWYLMKHNLKVNWPEMLSK